jgi:hypothetical protein
MTCGSADLPARVDKTAKRQVSVNDLTWTEGLPAAVIVTSADGTILGMNARSRESFASEGGGALTRALYASRQPNHYTIRKNGQRKIIHQMPWFDGGVFAGFVEISIPIPDELPHFDRD